LHIDDIERRADDGPCIDAIEGETPRSTRTRPRRRCGPGSPRSSSRKRRCAAPWAARAVIERRGQLPSGGETVV